MCTVKKLNITANIVSAYIESAITPEMELSKDYAPFQDLVKNIYRVVKDMEPELLDVVKNITVSFIRTTVKKGTPPLDCETNRKISVFMERIHSRVKRIYMGLE